MGGGPSLIDWRKESSDRRRLPSQTEGVRVTFRSKFLATLVVLMVSAQPITICAAQTKSQPATIVTHVDIIPDAYKPQSEENAARLLRSQRAATQHDADLISYVVLQQNGASNHFARSSRHGVMPEAMSCIKVPTHRRVPKSDSRFWVVRSTRYSAIALPSVTRVRVLRRHLTSQT